MFRSRKTIELFKAGISNKKWLTLAIALQNVRKIKINF